MCLGPDRVLGLHIYLLACTPLLNSEKMTRHMKYGVSMGRNENGPERSRNGVGGKEHRMKVQRKV